MLHPEIVPTIFSQSDEDYHDKLHLVEDLVTRIQVDVADGVFVPSTTVGAPTIEGQASSAAIDVHLMVAEPLAHVGEYSRVGADHLIFHVEACPQRENLEAVIEEIKTLGCRVGLALNLETPLSVLDNVSAGLDLVQLMSVEPGYSGQIFEDEVLPRVLSVRERLPQIPLAVDGGVSPKNIQPLVEAGATMLVIGAHLFDSSNVREYLARLRELI